ncbi:MAG: polyprenyl synthetase family protein [Bacteroidales bacterium]|nr:polyprenyl synthetase family protein [Bacteroidales bacterium]MCF8343656.1 polyprenyl synthetase family protein [Bacteroidales bacterium]MCF8377722.1 polyprenyl synthetase family protein [Bacteroidales bacterium]
MQTFESYFRKSMQSRVPLLDKITRFILKRKGKQMRPMFVFLSAEVCGGVTEKSHRAAALIELLHTATLVHDDVVDDSNERRGFFSLNALWKNKISVLVGDYLLSRGLLLSLDHDDFELLKIVSEATRQMSEGELLQIEKARKLDIEEVVYFDIIKKKTASLIASCCAGGAASTKAEKELIEKFKLFGEKVGIAFQIKDDLFDYESLNKTGKPVGVDIKEQKMTLPLIHMLKGLNKTEKRRIINIIKNHSDEPDKVSWVIDKVNNSGGIEYARNMMMKYREKAFDILQEFPECAARESLKQLVIYTTERKK